VKRFGRTNPIESRIVKFNELYLKVTVNRKARSAPSTAPGKILLELIEVQTGSYFGEDDIIRIEDDYRRK
jgi:hypothetical protein